MRKKQFLCLFLCSIISASAFSQAFAAGGPGQSGVTLPDGVTEEKWARLNDQKIEFDELYDLVQYFNTGVLDVSDQINGTVDDLKYTHEGMRKDIRKMRDDAEELDGSGATNSMEGMIEYVTLKYTADAMSNMADNMKRSLDKLDTSLQSNVTAVTKNVAYYANQLMIGYHSALANQAMLEKMVEACQAGVNAQKRGLSIGTATETDVLSAEKGLLTAQSSLLQLNNTVDSLKSSLCLMLGYSTDSMPEIGGLPSLDLSVIDAIDLQSDTQKAISNNYNLIEERHSSAKTTAHRNTKDASVEQNSQNVAIQVQSMYQKLKQAKNAYEAACTTYEKAVLEKGKADRSRQLGLLSDITYLQTEMAFLQAESTLHNAYNTLYQAYDTYQWAVNGVIM